MKASALYFSSQQLFLAAPVKSFCGVKGFLPQNQLRNFCKFENRKPICKIHPIFTIKAASSSSPSLGGSASDYPELIGKRVKKKQSRIAGIDQDELLDPRQLADPDSCFCEFKGVHVHYKVCEAEPSMSEEQETSQLDVPTKKIGFPMIFLHGFGASTFSWHRVMKPFAQITGSKVLAFDRPAFGLTSRVRHSVHSHADDDTMPLNPYSTAFSVLATLYFIDFLKSEKAVLVGHSAGSLTAVEAYFEAPDRVAALILVAPAIVAPRSATKSAKENQSDKGNKVQESNSTSDERPNLFARLGLVLSNFYRYIANTVMQMLKGILNVVSSLYTKALVAILRSAVAVTLVRMIIDKFGIAAVKNAWYDATQVTDHILHGYTKPLRTKDWDRALVEFTVAMLTDSQAKLKPPLEERLQNIACPVLIITGDSDRLVPSWNSERLSRAIPGSQLEIMKSCGHLPHEEKPDEFVSVVAKFFNRVFSGSGELCMQA
ncbi:abhydrolase domain-containing protein cgi-58-like isoform X2 [Chenopodium quinoa]|uniref:abhydrolase domain-containing protein cgi-58-like isoform X2 n=1 Tax=Chenopodium quinoa TaxID=63459 RepID=UPI000B77733F|nr:abhydrolase domain-containing protein cgi-58-like isoform X2 [Chenopodium quinoa]